MPAKKAAKKTGKARKASKKKLTPKQELFTENYIQNGGNGVQAAKAAGYQGDTNALNQQARYNLQNPTISARVRERVEGVAADTDEVLNLLGEHLRADIADFEGCFDEEGRLDLKEAKKRGVSRLVKKLRVTTRTMQQGDGAAVREVTTQIEFHDAQSAARTLVDVLGIKQQPRENDEQRKHDEQMAAAVKEEFRRLRVDENMREADAISILLAANPDARKWLQ